MRRLARHLSTLCSAVSLLLCVATLVFSGGSWHESDLWMWHRVHSDDLSVTERELSVIGERGRVGLLYDRTRVAAKHSGVLTEQPDGLSRSRGGSIAYFGYPAFYADWSWRGYGYSVGKSSTDGVRDSCHVWAILPWWMLAAMTAVLPVLWLSDRGRWRRVNRRCMAGLCAVCGYDLRASPERCPECGTAAEVAR